MGAYPAFTAQMLEFRGRLSNHFERFFRQLVAANFEQSRAVTKELFLRLSRYFFSKCVTNRRELLQHKRDPLFFHMFFRQLFWPHIPASLHRDAFAACTVVSS